jgi:hypothetical protein
LKSTVVEGCCDERLALCEQINKSASAKNATAPVKLMRIEINTKLREALEFRTPDPRLDSAAPLGEFALACRPSRYAAKERFQHKNDY